MKINKIGVVHDKVLDKNKNLMVNAVYNAISKKYDVLKIPFDEDFFDNIKNVNFVFNLATSGGKEGRQIHVPAILDLLNIPFTGSSAFVHTLCLDKFITKLVLSYYKISTPHFLLIKEKELNSFERNFNLSFPVIIKPVREGGALGLTKTSVVYNIEDVKREIEKIHKEFNEPALVEEFIEGKEVTCGIIGNGEDIEVLPFLEIDFYSLPEEIEKFYSYRVKNEIKDLKYYCPARLTKKEEENLKGGVINAFKALNLRDYSRIDTRIKNGKYFILEVNSLPLLVPNYSDILKMAEKAGFTYDDFILKILEISINRYP